MNNNYPSLPSSKSNSIDWEWLTTLLFLSILILVAALIGICARPHDLLSTFWPANALWAGLLIRYARFASVGGWSAAFVGFIAADLITGNTLVLTLTLTLANFVFAATCLILFRRLPTVYQSLESPRAILYLLLISAVAATASAITAVITSYSLAPIIFGNNIWKGIWSWLSSDFVNALLILPFMMTMPSLRTLYDRRKGLAKSIIKQHQHYSWQKIAQHYAPSLTLLLSIIAATAIGGPGAIAFHVPALLWCSLSYRIFTTALLTMLTSVWLMLSINFGFISLFPAHYLQGDLLNWSISIRMGIALITLVPLMVAASNQVQKKLVTQLRYAADYDFLTRTLSRSAFYTATEQLIQRAHAQQSSLSVFMLDLDHFKHVNDHYGHAAGDKALQEFATLVQNNLRHEDDVFARMGGEEFALVLLGETFADSLAIAERIRQQLQHKIIMLDQQHHFQVTVSIGVAHFHTLHHHLIDVLLAHADKALYQAKKSGRNQVCYRN